MDGASAGRAQALAVLRDQQQLARQRVGLSGAVSRGDVLARALARAEQREREAVVKEAFVHSGPYRYPLHTERLRWARTRDILERSSPGPDEDGVYLEMVARQAAAIEMILRQEHTGSPSVRGREICDRVLLGTLPALDPDALARRHGDFHFVLITAGMIEFVYQAAKASILSWQPVPAARGARYAFKCEPDDVAGVLARNPLPVKLLGATVEHYLFNGLPRTVGYSPPPENYQAPLGMLTNFNERFIVAHEYCHTLHDELDIVHPGNGMHGEEFASDVWAFHLVVDSGQQFDLLPPNLSVQGAWFVLTARDVLRQALDLARFGEVREDTGSATHPPIGRRLEVLRECYLQSVSPEDGDLSIRAARFASSTLALLWQRVLDGGAAGRWHGRALHRIWEGIR